MFDSKSENRDIAVEAVESVSETRASSKCSPSHIQCASCPQRLAHAKREHAILAMREREYAILAMREREHAILAMREREHAILAIIATYRSKIREMTFLLYWCVM